MTEEFLAIMREEIKTAVKETVNGKIDAINAKLDSHIAVVEPILEGLEASKLVGKAISWIGGVLIGLGAMYTLVKGIIMHT